MTLEQYIDAYRSLDVSIREKIDALQEDWSPDTPPVTLLFAGVGKAVAERFDYLSLQTKQVFSELLERGLSEDDPIIGDATATGTIEALISISDKRPGLWDEIQDSIGPKALSYANAWISFTSK